MSVLFKPRLYPATLALTTASSCLVLAWLSKFNSHLLFSMHMHGVEQRLYIGFKKHGACMGWLACDDRAECIENRSSSLSYHQGGWCVFVQKGEWKGRKGEKGGLVLRGTAYLDFLSI